MASETQRVQDDLREQQLARELRLERSGSRMGWDARDEAENPYELKTTTRESVTTGRDVGLPYFQRLRTNYVVVAKGENTTYGFNIEEMYFMPPGSLDGWAAKYEDRLRRDTAIGEAAVDALRAAGASPEDLTRLQELVARGMTLNNPKIPMRYIRENGIRLEAPTALHLKELVMRYRLPEADPLPPLAVAAPDAADEAEEDDAS